MWTALLACSAIQLAPIQDEPNPQRVELDDEHVLEGNARWGPPSAVDQNQRVIERSYILEFELSASLGESAPGEAGHGFAPLAVRNLEIERARLERGASLVLMDAFTNPVIVAPGDRDPYRDVSPEVPPDRWRVVALHHMPLGTRRIVDRVKGRVELLRGGRDHTLVLNTNREDGVFRPLRNSQLSRERITAELAVERQSRLVVEMRGSLERLVQVRGTSRGIELEPLDTRQSSMDDGGLQLEWDLEGDWPDSLGLEFEVLTTGGQAKTVRLKLPKSLTFDAKALNSTRLSSYGLEAHVRGLHPKVYRVRGQAVQPRLVRGLVGRLLEPSTSPALELSGSTWESDRFEVWTRLNPEAPLGTRPALVWRVGSRWDWERFDIGPLNDPGDPELWSPSGQ